nr:exocyst complex component 7 [Hymenolepis microstoma]
MNQLPAQMCQIIAIRDKFIEVSEQSDEKLSAMIEAAKDFRSGMEPLKKEVDQLQTRVKNLQFCIEGLSHVQNFYKTGREVEQTIIQGPAENLTEYLKAMDRIKDSLVYFNQNDTDHLEYTRLSTLLSNGLKALHVYFGENLNKSFSTMPSDVLYKLAEKDDTISLDGTKQEQESTPTMSTILDCESISEESIRILQEISAWLRRATTLVNSKEGAQKSHSHLARLFRSQGSGVSMDGNSESGGYQISQSLAQYCEFRKDLMCTSLAELREYQKSLEKNAQNARSRSTVASSQLSIGTPGRRRGLKAVGIVWDANSRRGVASDIRETDDLDSEHYSTSLSAFLILTNREQLLLDRLNLAANSHEAHFAYSLICRNAVNDLMTEGGAYVRLMSRVISRHEFYMIVSLLTIMRRFIDLSPTIVETLKTVSSLSQPLTDIVCRFRAQIKATFDAFLQQVQPGAGSSQVPPDATVHELASNAILFLEKLFDYQVTVGTCLTWEEVRIAPENTFQYLTTVGSKPKMARSAFGQYIFRVTTSLVGNIDKKAEAYSIDLTRIVFQMNNLRYILTNLKSTGLQEILDEYDNTATEKLNKILNESKQVYVRACMRCMNLPSLAFVNQFSQRKQMDSKERSQMKDMWTNINQGIANLMKQHSQLSIPDKDFREELRVCVSKELIPLYQTFHDRSLQTPFTSRREKYIKMTPAEFQTKLNQLFGPVSQATKF